MKRRALYLIVAIALFPTAPAAEYKSEFKMSIVVSNETAWGRAAGRFADAVKFRTHGRIQIKPYFNGHLFAGKQATEFLLLQQGNADFAIGSTINWSPQVKELNLFALPFMFQSYKALDAVETGEPGERLFRLMDQKGVVPIAWGENGFRELTNSKRPIRRPEDLQSLKIRVVGIPIFAETVRALGANPVSMNFDEAQVAFKEGTVDGQENPVGLIISYQLWALQKHLTLWHYAIDPLILAVSGKTWASLSAEDRDIVRNAGEEIMALQKKEAREGLEDTATIVNRLHNIYGMEVVELSAADLEAFRERSRPVYVKWANEIGLDLVHGTERIIERAK
jgi:tripartite ATP-independent transporter DctP family solute receptor